MSRMIVWNSLRDRIPKPEACGKKKISEWLLARRGRPAQDRKSDREKVRTKATLTLVVHFQQTAAVLAISVPCTFRRRKRILAKSHQSRLMAAPPPVSAEYRQQPRNAGKQLSIDSTIPLNTEYLLASQSLQQHQLNRWPFLVTDILCSSTCTVWQNACRV